MNGGGNDLRALARPHRGRSPHSINVLVSQGLCGESHLSAPQVGERWVLSAVLHPACHIPGRLSVSDPDDHAPESKAVTLPMTATAGGPRWAAAAFSLIARTAPLTTDWLGRVPSAMTAAGVDGSIPAAIRV